MTSELILLPSVLIAFAAVSWVITRVNLPGYLEVLAWLGNKTGSVDELKALNKKLESLAIPVSAEVFSAGRLVLTLIPLTLGGILLFSDPFRGIVLLVLAVILWRMPNRFLEYKEKTRKEDLEREFSYMINQVRIYSKASDHYQALKIVPYTLKGPLKREMEIMSAELEMSDITEALENFSNRCGFQLARDFAQVLLVAIRTGINVDEIFSNFAKVTRQRRVNKLKRWIKIQPIVISVFPALLLMIYMLMWIVPMYGNIIERLKAIN